MKHIIPAAGKGSRFSPITDSVPKEMLTLGTQPLIQYAVEEVADGTSIIVTTYNKHEMMSKYLSSQASYGVEYAYQHDAKGLGHAVLQGRRQAEGELRVGVILPDLVIPTWVGLMDEMIHSTTDSVSVVALQRVPASEVHRYGIADIEEDDVTIRGIVEKPSMEEAPSNLAVIGRYVLTTDIFEILEETTPGVGGEIQLTDALNVQAEQGKLYGYIVPDNLEMYDCGVPEAWAKSNYAFMNGIHPRTGI